jgi:L-threonylcarbamoyladenylate synthase
MLDAGQLEGGIGSTVIDVTFDVPKILREGAVPAKDIFAILD